MIDLDLSASVDAILSEFTEGIPLRKAPKREVIAKAPTPRRVKPFRPTWTSEALVLVTETTTCACGETYTAPGGLLVRFRHRNGREIWETNEHVASHRRDIPRVERILQHKTLYCHKCFDQCVPQPELDLQLWPIIPCSFEERLDSQLHQPKE